MKEQILEISKKLELGEITSEHAQYLFDLLIAYGIRFRIRDEYGE